MPLYVVWFGPQIGDKSRSFFLPENVLWGRFVSKEQKVVISMSDI